MSTAESELAFLTRDYPEMEGAARFALAWSGGDVERVLTAVRHGRIPTRCACDWPNCPGWVMTAPSEFGDILIAAAGEIA